MYNQLSELSQVDMVRGGSGSYRLKMNESEIEAEIHTLRDGGLLMQASMNLHDMSMLFCGIASLQWYLLVSWILG